MNDRGNDNEGGKSDGFRKSWGNSERGGRGGFRGGKGNFDRKRSFDSAPVQNKKITFDD